MMKPSELKIFEKLCFKEWTFEMADRFRVPDSHRLYQADADHVTEIIKHLGYASRFQMCSKVFIVKMKFAGAVYYASPHVDFGHVRLELWARKDGIKIGGLTISWCKRYDIHLGQETSDYLPMPAFRNYDELQNILHKYFRMYEKFKVAVHESGYLQNL